MVILMVVYTPVVIIDEKEISARLSRNWSSTNWFVGPPDSTVKSMFTVFPRITTLVEFGHRKCSGHKTVSSKGIIVWWRNLDTSP